MTESANTQQEIDNCTIMKEIKNTKLTCSGTGEEKCSECPKAEPALADMHKTEATVGDTTMIPTEENAETVPMGTTSLAAIVTGNVPKPTEEEIAVAVEENNKSFQVRAKEKLEDELKKAKDKSFAEPVIGYLLKRCAEDEGLAEDVCQKHKTWEKCFNFIYESARKSAKGNSRCAVRDDVVYEWAEDYYHMDDKAEEEKRAKEKAEREKKQKEDQKKRIEGMEKRKAAKEAATTPKESVKKEEKTKVAPVEKPKKNSKDMDGQMDLFSLMGL